MTEKDSTRRKFLKFFGLSAGATMVAGPALALFTNVQDIRKLNPEQQDFMIDYGKWMDEFIEVIRIQKTNPGDAINQKKMIALTHRAEEFKPQLNLFLKDESFALIYRASIERMTKEI
jgi:hypothetical protein